MGDSSQQGTVVGESIPTPMIIGIVGGLLFAIIMMVCHICISKCLVKQKLKQLPRARKVKVKKAKKGKKDKKGKKGKKGKGEESSTATGTTGTASQSSAVK